GLCGPRSMRLCPRRGRGSGTNAWISRSEIRRQLWFWCRDGRSLRQIEHAVGQAVEEGEHLRRLHHVGVFGIHIAEVDGVARLRTVEAALFGERDAIVEAERIEDGSAHTARRGRTGDDHAVAAKQGQIARHIGAEKAGWLLLQHDDVLWPWRDFGDDVVAIHV